MCENITPYHKIKKGIQDMETRKYIAANIIRLRKERNVSQDDFAAQCFISTRYLSAIETGNANPSLDVLERIATAFGITLEELIRNHQQ